MYPQPQPHQRGDVHLLDKDSNFWFNPQAFAAPALGTWGTGTRDILYGPGQNEWDLALFKNFRTAGRSLVPIPTSATFGRVTGKDDARRDVQLSVRFQF